MSNPKIWEHHVIGPVQTNCYIVSNTSGEAVLFDPGGPEAVKIVKDLKERGIEIKHVLVTHGHFDHLGWATEVQKAVEGAKVYLHQEEKETYEVFQSWLPKLGYKGIELREPDIWVKEGQTLDVSGIKFQVVHTPGHSPGSATYIHESEAFVGDLIFKGSIGRVDLPFSNPKEMERSLLKILKEIDPQTHLYPGHGEFTTMREEIQHNPFLQAIMRGRSIY